MFKFLKDTKKLVLVAMLVALSFLLSLIEIPTPFLSYLSLDASELPILVAADLLGGGALIIVTILRSLLRFMIKGTLIFGELAAIIMSLSLGFIFIGLHRHFEKSDEEHNKKLVNTTLIITITLCVLAIVLIALSSFSWKVAGIITFALPLIACLFCCLKKDSKTKREFVQIIISGFVVTIIMVVMNFLFLTPSNALQKFAFYPEVVNTWFNGSYQDYIYSTILPLVPFNMLKIFLTIIIYYTLERVVKSRKRQTKAPNK